VAAIELDKLPGPAAAAKTFRPCSIGIVWSLRARRKSFGSRRLPTLSIEANRLFRDEPDRQEREDLLPPTTDVGVLDDHAGRGRVARKPTVTPVPTNDRTARCVTAERA
jgi:hypothetical protein